MKKFRFMFFKSVCTVVVGIGLAVSSVSALQKNELAKRGIHVTVPKLSTKIGRKQIESLFNTEINTIVITVKDDRGYVYIRGIKNVEANDAYISDMPDLEEFVSGLKEKGIYTIARVVVFRDDQMARKQPRLAIKNFDGSIWTDKINIAWLDPYNKDGWDYVLQVAEKAVDIGFEEIQFDYVRFPYEGHPKKRKYSEVYSCENASKALVDFLKEANKRLKAKGAKISIDVFGLTTTATDDMGIGQKIVEMTEWVDYVSPMVYPSHYGKFNYGITDPNKEPYKVVCCAIEDAQKRIPVEKLRPWLQNFSLRGCSYGRSEVRAQIQACYNNNVKSWLLWNPKCVYTTSALKSANGEDVPQKSDNNLSKTQ